MNTSNIPSAAAIGHAPAGTSALAPPTARGASATAAATAKAAPPQPAVSCSFSPQGLEALGHSVAGEIGQALDGVIAAGTSGARQVLASVQQAGQQVQQMAQSGSGMVSSVAHGVADAAATAAGYALLGAVAGGLLIDERA